MKKLWKKIRGDCTTIFGHSTEFYIVNERAWERRVDAGERSPELDNPEISYRCRRCGKQGYNEKIAR